MSLTDRVAALFEKTFGMKAANFTPDLAPEDVPRWDSVGHMTLVTELESEFGVRFDVDELTEMSSGGKIIELLRAKGVGD
jgi:acyl carrier protein